TEDASVANDADDGAENPPSQEANPAKPGAPAADEEDDDKEETLTTPGLSWQEILAAILGGGQPPQGNPDSPSTSTDPTANEPSLPPEPIAGAEDCIGADPFVCEIEHEITRLNNELRGSSAPLSYHAKLSYVSRDWSEKQANAGRISHTGFPQARGQLYVATF